MDRIYDQAKDKNIAAIVIYGKSGESKPAAYADSACTIKMTTSELKDAFLKRAVVLIGSDYYIPIAFSVASEIGSITYAKAGSASGTAETATLAAIKD